MRCFVIGLVLGACGGLVAGLALQTDSGGGDGSKGAALAAGAAPVGDSAGSSTAVADETPDAPSDRGRARVAANAELSATRADVAHSHGRRSPEDQAFLDKARAGLIQAAAQRERGVNWDVVLGHLRTVLSQDPEYELPDDVVELILNGHGNVPGVLIAAWSTEERLAALRRAIAAPSEGPASPLWKHAYLLASYLRNEGEGSSDLVLALMRHGRPEMRSAGLELSPTYDFTSFDELERIAKEDDVPDVQRRALVALATRADVQDGARAALSSAVTHLLATAVDRPEVLEKVVEHIYVAGDAAIPSAPAILTAGGAPEHIEHPLVWYVVGSGAGRQLLDARLSPQSELVLVTALADQDDLDRALLTELRDRALRTAHREDFDGSQIVFAYSRLGDPGFAETVARDASAPPNSRAIAAIELTLVDAYVQRGLALAAELAASAEPVAVRRALADHLAELFDSDVAGPAQRGAIELLERLEARDASSWVRAAATDALSGVRPDPDE